MNFCSNCGSGNLEFKIPTGDNMPRYCCENCDSIHYQNPNIIVGAIPVWQGKVLLALRNIEPRKGFWNLPCGFLELNETIEEGAVREVSEETGAQISLTHLHTVYNLPDANQVYIIFAANMHSNHFKTTSESADVQLFELNDIPWDKIAFSSNTFALERFLEDKKEAFRAVHIGTFKKSKSNN